MDGYDAGTTPPTFTWTKSAGELLAKIRTPKTRITALTVH
jgi:hypothetical protein